MLLVKTPLRLSFFGGSSDLPAHYTQHGGATLSVTFNKYVYVALMYTPQPHIKLSYSNTEYASNLDELQHDIVRETLREFCIDKHIEITSFADIPTVGTGLGASSAFAVCLVRALEVYTRQSHLTSTRTRETASHIELHRVGSPIGIQDHVAAAHGGFVFAEYDASGVQLSKISDVTLWPELAHCLFLVKMPSRAVSANDILKTPLDAHQVNDLAKMARQASYLALTRQLYPFGELLHSAWEIKKQLHPHITTPEIDTAYQLGKDFGLLGGKLLGAGNGGFLLMCATSQAQRDAAIASVYSSYTCYPVQFDPHGVRVVYHD